MCEKQAALKTAIWKIHLNLNANEHYHANCADKTKERKENNL